MGIGPFSIRRFYKSGRCMCVLDHTLLFRGGGEKADFLFVQPFKNRRATK